MLSVIESNNNQQCIKTDTEISKKKDFKLREFVKYYIIRRWISINTIFRWEVDPNNNICALEEEKPDKTFNQFEVNEKKFGLEAGFSEETYTTPLNLHKVTPEILRKAEELHNVMIWLLYIFR